MSSAAEQSIPENDPLSRALWLVDRLGGDTRTGKCCCPAHDDEDPSFDVSLTEFSSKGAPLFKCRAGCEQQAVIAALRGRGLWPVPGSVPKGSNGPAVTHRSAEDRRQYAARIYKGVQAQNWNGDLLKPYFASRKLDSVPSNAWVTMPAGRSGEERQIISEDPGIVFRVRDRDNTFLGIHVIWLNAEMTGKREAQPQRQSYGPIKGGYVMLGDDREPDPDKPLIVAEGIETAMAAMQIAGLPAALVGLGTNTKAVELPDHREIIICADNGDAGQHTARALAQRYAGTDRVIRIATPAKPEGGKQGWDWNDALMGGPRPRANLILEAPVFEQGEARPEGGEDQAELLDELAALDPLEYELRRKEAAEALGIRVAVLDQYVAARREPQQAPPLYPHWDVTSWDEPVDTDALLRDLTSQIRRYVATLGKRAIVPALWVMGTYVHEAATHSPLLLATSPEPDSGKSTMLGVIGFLARRSLLSVSISGPALFRSIAKWQPTFIIDEADTALVKNADLKEVVNSGWTRNQGVIRCDAETNDPILFSTFAPKAIGMKGKKLPDTTLKPRHRHRDETQTA